MRQRNHIATYAVLLFGCLTAWGHAADPQSVCGSNTESGSAAPIRPLLSDDFRALLHPSAVATTEPAQHTTDNRANQHANQTKLDVTDFLTPFPDQPAVPLERPAPSDAQASLATVPRHAIPPNAGARTCVLKDANTHRELLTLTIPGDIHAETISAEELAERRAAMKSLRRLPAFQPSAPHNSSLPATPRLNVAIDKEWGRIRVDSNNADIRDVLTRLASKTGQPIQFHPKLEQAISTSTSAENLTVLLRTMLEPFNYSVIADAGGLVVCAPNQTAANVIAACRRQHRPAPILPPRNNPSIGLVAQTHAAPPKVPDVAPTHFTTSDDVSDKSLPKDVSNKPIQLVTASEIAELEASSVLADLKKTPVKSRTEARSSSPRRSPSSKLPPISIVPQLDAGAQIARIAQDAFAAGRDEYAANILREGTKKLPDCALLHRMLGESLYLAEDYSEASKVLFRAIKLSPDDAMANEIMGKSLAALGEKRQATHYLNQARKCSQRQAQ